MRGGDSVSEACRSEAPLAADCGVEAFYRLPFDALVAFHNELGNAFAIGNDERLLSEIYQYYSDFAATVPGVFTSVMP